MSEQIDLNYAEKLTGMTFKTIKKRLDEHNVKPTGKDGKRILYDSMQVLEAIYSQKRTIGGEKVRDALIAEQLREKKRENDLAEGLVAPVSMITDAIFKVGTVIMSNLEALPGEMKRANPELTAHDINSAKKTISRCCEAIAEMKEYVG